MSPTEIRSPSPVPSGRGRALVVCGMIVALAGWGCDSESSGDDGSDTAEAMTETAATPEDDGPCSECDAADVCQSQSRGGHCVCDAGHEWVDPGDAENFECAPIPPRDGECVEENTVEQAGQCFCEAGFNWCSGDPADLTCCPDPAQAEPEPEPE